MQSITLSPLREVLLPHYIRNHFFGGLCGEVGGGGGVFGVGVFFFFFLLTDSELGRDSFRPYCAVRRIMFGLAAGASFRQDSRCACKIFAIRLRWSPVGFWHESALRCETGRSDFFIPRQLNQLRATVWISDRKVLSVRGKFRT